MNDLTSVCLVSYISNEKRLTDLVKVLQSLEANIVEPAEIIIVDDHSPLAEDVVRILDQFMSSMHTSHPQMALQYVINETNLKHARSQNKSMELAKGDILIHLEDDVAVDFRGWNQVFAKYLRDHPEVGQVLPKGSGRGEHIARAGYPLAGYAEFAWGLGGVWAINREIYDKLGPDVWDPFLTHQLEPDFNVRVRMAGYRLAEVKEFAMTHFGEGDEAETFSRRLQITIGVYNMLQKWNRRFMGFWDYRSPFSNSFDDFPINEAFRRQLAAWFVSQSWMRDDVLAKADAGEIKFNAGQREIYEKMRDEERACMFNEKPEAFKFPGHYGVFEKVIRLRPKDRERERELCEKMRDGFWFKDEPELHVQVMNLAKHFKVIEYQGFDMTNEDSVKKFLSDKAYDFIWTAQVVPYDFNTPTIHKPS